jgi:hypothetical protein
MIDKNGMRQRDILMIALFIIGAALFLLQHLYVESAQKAQNEYLSKQKEVTTCDLNYILDYKNPYMGNASNLTQLFHKLPLSDEIKDFRLDSDKLAVHVNYKSTVINAGKESMENKSFGAEGTKEAIDKIYVNEVEKSLIYNSVAAFSLINNLKTIYYHFSDTSYQISRNDMEAIYGDLDNLLDTGIWNKKVRDPLSNTEYVTKLSDKLFK